MYCCCSDPYSALNAKNRTSATNCARIYNNAFRNPVVTASCPAVWACNLELNVEQVWTGFFLHSLLLDHMEQGSVLGLEHDAPSQSRRLRPALEARNARMVGPGQEEWNHACDLCCWIYEDENGVLCTFSFPETSIQHSNVSYRANKIRSN